MRLVESLAKAMQSYTSSSSLIFYFSSSPTVVIQYYKKIYNWVSIPDQNRDPSGGFIVILEIDTRVEMDFFKSSF